MRHASGMARSLGLAPARPVRNHVFLSLSLMWLGSRRQLQAPTPERRAEPRRPGSSRPTAGGVERVAVAFGNAEARALPD